MQEILNNFFVFDLPGEVIMSLVVMLIILILCFIIYFLCKKADPLKKPKGLLAIVEIGIEKVDGLVLENMGTRFPNFGGYICAVALFIFLSFLIGISGLPSPFTYLGVPLSIALCTFIMIHVTSAKYTGLHYFKRYVDPIPVFLPINLISMWSPLLSLTLRLFGNAISGWALMSLVYWALMKLSSAIFAFLPAGVNSIFIAPLITPFLHMYFDIFSGAIQTLVFVFLSMLLIAVEVPEEIKVEKELALN